MMAKQDSRSGRRSLKRQKADLLAKLLSGDGSEISKEDIKGNGCEEHQKENGKDGHKDNNSEKASEIAERGSKERSGEQLEKISKEHVESSKDCEDHYKHLNQEVELLWEGFPSEEDYESNEEEEKHKGPAKFEYIRIRPDNGPITAIPSTEAEQPGIQPSATADEDASKQAYGSTSSHEGSKKEPDIQKAVSHGPGNAQESAPVNPPGQSCLNLANIPINNSQNPRSHKRKKREGRGRERQLA